jgi:PAS domain S-box-containing protein
MDGQSPSRRRRIQVRSWLQNLESGKPHDIVCRIRGADGRYRWFEVRGEPLRASDGAVLSWYGVLIDIDDRRKAEETVRESEFKLRQIIETVPSLLWSLGPNGEQTQLNQRALDYIGVRYEDLLRLGWTAFLHPDDLSETANAFSHSIQTGTSYQAVHRLRRADGEYRWHQARGEPLRDRQGRVIQWYGLTVDIDEGKRAEDRLRRSEVYLAEAQRLSHTGSFGWTPSTGELHWSDETFRILEFDPSIKPTIERVLQRIHPDDRAMIRQLIDERSSGEKDFDVTHRLLMPDGSVKFVRLLSHALKDAAGNLEIVRALMDVTENTRLYRDLAEREARVRRLIDSNIIGIFIWEAEGRILEANDAFLHMVGYDRKDIVSGQVRWTDLAPAEWRERDERALAERKSTGKLQPYEKEYFRKDGSRVPR